jgi:hypothetical protein
MFDKHGIVTVLSIQLAYFEKQWTNQQRRTYQQPKMTKRSKILQTTANITKQAI